jgi:hypothetical protein
MYCLLLFAILKTFPLISGIDNPSRADNTKVARGGATMITEGQIRELAHSIWEQEGRPHGKDLEHYFRAKKILEERGSSQVIELASPPPKIALEPPQPTVIELGTLLTRKSRSHKKK